MAKITKFGHNSDFYYERAIDKADANDDIACLDYLNCALKLAEPYSENEVTIRLEIAESYTKMGLLEKANKEYFKLCGFAGDYLDEVFYGFIRNYYIMGNIEIASYYMQMGLELDIIDDDQSYFPDEITNYAMGKSSKPEFSLIKPANGEHMLHLAKQLMGGGDTEFAKQILQSIPKESESFVEAANCLALIELSDGNAQKGLEYSDEALAKEPSEFNSLVTKILGLNMADKKEDIGHYLAQLEESSDGTWADSIKISLCCAEIGDSERVYNYTKKVLKESPYEREMLLYHAIACFNLGKKIEAKKAIYKLSVIYPDDTLIRYYARKIDKTNDGKALNFSTDLPIEERQRLTGVFENRLSSTASTRNFAATIYEDEELKEAVLWALSSKNEKICIYVASLLAQSHLGFYFIKDVLVDAECPLVIKKAILNIVFMQSDLKKILVAVNDRLQWLSPSLPNVTINTEFIDAYWQVYSALAFIENDFSRKLNYWYKKIVIALENEQNINYKANTIAALIAFKSKISKIFELNSYCCEVFDCGIEDFVLYCKILDEYTAQSRAKIKKNKAGVKTDND